MVCASSAPASSGKDAVNHDLFIDGLRGMLTVMGNESHSRMLIEEVEHYMQSPAPKTSEIVLEVGIGEERDFI